MQVFKLPNAAASKVTATSTATRLYDLIQTAAATNPQLPGFLNEIFITPEDGDIRVTFDGNAPTSTQGFLVRSGACQAYSGVPLSKMRLIRAGGSNVACSLVIGHAAVDSQE